MKLASIISVWADALCLLPYCIKNHLQFCDGVLVVWSQMSNHGNKNDAVLEYILANGHDHRVEFFQLEPAKGLTPLTNETRKRNYGIEQARAKGFSHFIVCDADEFYFPEEMIEEKKRFDDPKLNGLVSGLRVYIGKPTLCTTDHTLVPTIHKLGLKTYVGGFKEYPYAYDAGGRAHIDPSRRVNYINGIEWSNTVCQHYSYVRSNIDLKINNSSANLQRSRQVIYDELRDAKPGHVSKLYHQELREVPNYFDIVL
jgi:hypothetical protein